MYLDTSGKIAFYGAEDILTDISDWFEEAEYGDAFIDSEDGALIVHLDPEAISENKQSIIDIMTNVYQVFPGIESAMGCGEYDFESKNKIKKFEVRLIGSTLKYRETGWILDDDDKDYDELIDDGYGDVDEEEYFEHQHRLHSGIDDSQDEFGDWECIDLTTD